MKRWIRRSLIGLLGVGVLFGGLAACSHQRYGHGGLSNLSEADATKLRERLIDKASRELQLDDAQRTRLGQLADALKAQRAALMAGANPHTELQALVAGTQFDRARAQALVDGKTAALRDGAPTLITAFGDFYDSLRPEQQQKLRDFMARGREGHRHGFWRG